MHFRILRLHQRRVQPIIKFSVSKKKQNFNSSILFDDSDSSSIYADENYSPKKGRKRVKEQSTTKGRSSLNTPCVPKGVQHEKKMKQTTPTRNSVPVRSEDNDACNNFISDFLVCDTEASLMKGVEEFSIQDKEMPRQKREALTGVVNSDSGTSKTDLEVTMQEWQRVTRSKTEVSQSGRGSSNKTENTSKKKRTIVNSGGYLAYSIAQESEEDEAKIKAKQTRKKSSLKQAAVNFLSRTVQTEIVNVKVNKQRKVLNKVCM